MQKNLIITVNYCQAELTIKLLNNLYDLEGMGDFIIAVADNSPDEDDFHILQEYMNKSKLASLHLFRSQGNIGYFGAAGFVMKEMGLAWEDFRFLIICNNDIEIRDKEFFVKLRDDNSHAGVIAPDIISSVTNKHQNPHRMHPVSSWQKLQYRMLFSEYQLGLVLYLLRKMVRAIFFSDSTKSSLVRGEIYSAHGAFMIFTDEYFKAGGKIDNDFFLFAEEDSVAAQCEKFDLKIFCRPDLVLFHNEHISTGGSGFKRDIYQLQKNAYRYIKEHYPGFY